MATNKNKRPHIEDSLESLYFETESDNELDQKLFPRFIVLESIENTPITKLSPFIVEKTMKSLIKTLSIKKTKEQHHFSRSSK